MGTWGTGLYSDDTACDIRSDWNTGLRWGRTAEDLTESFVNDYGSDDPVVTLVLADLQWRSGRIVPRVRAQALRIVSDGTDLKRWTEASAKDQRARAVVLLKLRAQLEREPPPPVPMKVPRAAVTPMKVGEVYAWRLLDGRFAFFQVCGMCKNAGASLAPSVRVFDFVSDSVPPVAELADVPSRRTIKRFKTAKIEPTFREHPQVAFGVYGPGQYPRARLRRLGVLPVPAVLDDDRKVIGSSWLGADELFPTMYGLGWWVGDVVAFKRDSGRYVPLAICGISTLREGDVTVPYLTVEILEWSRSDVPTAKDLPRLKPIASGARMSIAGLPPTKRFAYLGHLPRESSEAFDFIHRWDDIEAAFAAGRLPD